jgi:uncharacterized protein (TIGR03435 family)
MAGRAELPFLCEVHRMIGKLCLVALLTCGIATAQSPAASDQPSSPQPQRRRLVPEWGVMSFETATIKPSKPGSHSAESNFPIGPYDWYNPTGGILSARNFPLANYILFAYKVFPNDRVSLVPQLPAWVRTTRYDIQAQAADHMATKDQIRLMVQSLLADRFHLKIHTETKTVPIYALVLSTPGKTGPQLQPHPPGDAKCSTKPSEKSIGIFPASCGAIGEFPPRKHGNIRYAARNVDFSRIATDLPALATGFDRQILDQTGLSGQYDFNLEWTPVRTAPLPTAITHATPNQPDPNFVDFSRALDEQLGLKLIPQQAPMQVLVLDHIERPSEN